jgi:flagellar motor switch protein FliM
VRLTREHSHLIRVAMQTFARQSTTVLTTSLRALCLMHDAQIEELSYDEYLSMLPDGSVSGVLSMEPLAGKALLNIDLTTLLTMVDHLLGGPGSAEQPDRSLTDIEQALVRQILSRMLRELAYAMEPIAKTTPTLVALEGNTQFVQAANPTDPVVMTTMQLQVGQNKSTARICLPYAMLAAPLAAQSRREDHTERNRARAEAAKATSRRLSDVAVDVTIRFDPLRMSSSQIGNLTVGDVLSLGHPTAAPLSVTSASTTFARAVPGSSGRRLAVLIVSAP